ncbi:MAG: peptidylprolyl isomerase [Planctomycetota bacterium]
MAFRLIAALAVLAALPAAVYADVITLKNGREYEGKVIKEENGILELRIRGGTVRIPVSEIKNRKASEFDLGVAKFAVRYREITFGNDAKLAKKVTENLAEGKYDFTEAAKMYSTDSLSAKKGGDRGWLTLSQSDYYGTSSELLQEKLFSLPVGKVSEPFRLYAGDEWHLVLVEKVLYRDVETGRLLDPDGNPAMPDFNAILILEEFEGDEVAKRENLGERIVREFRKILEERPGLTCFAKSDTHVQAPPADYTVAGTITKSRDMNIFSFTLEVIRGAHEGHGEESHQHDAMFSENSELIIGTDMLRREVKRVANLAYSAIIRDSIESEEKKASGEKDEETEHEHGPGCGHNSEKEKKQEEDKEETGKDSKKNEPVKEKNAPGK